MKWLTKTSKAVIFELGIEKWVRICERDNGIKAFQYGHSINKDIQGNRLVLIRQSHLASRMVVKSNWRCEGRAQFVNNLSYHVKDFMTQKQHSWESLTVFKWGSNRFRSEFQQHYLAVLWLVKHKDQELRTQLEDACQSPTGKQWNLKCNRGCRMKRKVWGERPYLTEVTFHEVHIQTSFSTFPHRISS